MRTRALWRGAVIGVLVGAMVSMLAGMAVAAPDRFYRQQVHWKPCATADLDGVGAQCADVLVPLDYSQPAGRTMTVGISRIPATDPGARSGVLLTNPGGPGAPGLNMTVALRKTLSPAVRSRYDLIGMDPRGVGRSAPVDCGWPLPTMHLSAGVNALDFAETVAVEAALAAQCVVTHGDRLGHFTTRNIARDIDVIRAALGERTLNYYGASYGTYLGAVFTQMFPGSAGRMVFDAAVDPDRYWVGMFADMGPVNEAALDSWAEWAASRDREYRLGTTGPQIRGLIEGLIRQSSARPLSLGGLPVTAHVIPTMLFGMLALPTLNPMLARTVRQLADAAEGKSVQLDPEQQKLLNTYAQLGSSEAAVSCGDVAAPRDPVWYWNNIERSRATQPVFGPLVNNISACAFWPAPLEPPTVVANTVTALIVGATGDPRTVYPQALALHRKLSGSRLITLADSRTHVSFRPNLSACVNDAVNAYLGEGRLPARDVTCQL